MRRSSRYGSSYQLETPPVSHNTHGWKTLRQLAPYLWQHKWRVLFSFACLITAKLANVSVPIVFKEMIDSLSATDIALGLPVLLLLLYGTLRFANSLFTELREILFARVTQEAVRRIPLEVFRHLHALSLRFHLERQTGGMSRDIERGNLSISSLITYALYSILPTLVEIAASHGVSIQQVVIRWHVQEGLITFPKSSNPARIRSLASWAALTVSG